MPIARYRPRRPGFSLIEVVATLAVTGIVLGSVTGALRAMTLHGERLQTSEKTRSNSDIVLHQMRDELTFARTFSAPTDKSVTFNVPDITGDAVDDVIAYAWTGTAGDPLTRQVNGGLARPVVTSVTSFALEYRNAASTSEDVENESPEAVLIYNDSNLNLDKIAISNGDNFAQYFKPTLPAEATGYRITEIRVRAASTGATDGITTVKLMKATSGKSLTSEVLATQTLAESSLSTTYLWQPIQFPNAPIVAPGQSLGVVFEFTSGSDASALIEIQRSGVVSADLGLIRINILSILTGLLGGQSLLFYSYGTYTSIETVNTPGPLKSVHISVESAAPDSDNPLRSETGATCLNQPALSGP